MEVLPGGHGVRIVHRQVIPVDIKTGAFTKYVEDEEMASLVSEYAHAVDIWPGPIHVSPLLHIVSQDKRQKIPRWTDSYWSLVKLRLLFNFLTTVPGLPLLGDVKQIRANVVEVETKLSRDFQEKPPTPETFEERLRASTIKRIHIHEFAIWKLLGLNLPIEDVLTPRISVPDTLKWEYPRSYFEGKQMIRNRRLREANPEAYEDRVWFTHNPECWKREYFDFMTKE